MPRPDPSELQKVIDFTAREAGEYLETVADRPVRDPRADEVAGAQGGPPDEQGGGGRPKNYFAAQQAANKAAGIARDSGMRSCEVRVNGPGSGRESAIRAVLQAGIEVRIIRDVTPIPHNGCRPPKRRRV